jgi:hypothetical protein
MLENHLPDGPPRPPVKPPAKRAGVAPTASRTVARFLNDVGQLLEERHFEAAARLAGDVPTVAVALADPELNCSPEKIHAWCEQWVRPSAAARDAPGLEQERVSRSVCERVTRESGESSAVPLRALKRLRLRRHVRNPPRGYLPPRMDQLDPHDAAAALYSETLLEAGRRWYARSAVHDPVVQQNLSRLAVLT